MKGNLSARRNRIRWKRECFAFKSCLHVLTLKIYTEFWPVKILHCVNSDGPKFGQNGCGTHLSQISATPYTAVLKVYRAEFKINSVSVRVNKASWLFHIHEDG